MQNEHVDDIEYILSRFTGLTFHPENHAFRGTISLLETDFYEVIIDISPFPKLFPDVFEV